MADNNELKLEIENLLNKKLSFIKTIALDGVSVESMADIDQMKDAIKACYDYHKSILDSQNIENPE